MTMRIIGRACAAILIAAAATLYWVANPIQRVQTAGRAIVIPLPAVPVEGQPLAANIERLIEALEYLGAPLPAGLRADLVNAGQARDAQKLQELLESRVLLAVHINPEARVKAARGPAPAVVQQAGYTPVLVKVVNESRGMQKLRIGSPQSGPVYAGVPIGFWKWRCTPPHR
jgi:hypothetical protein